MLTPSSKFQTPEMKEVQTESCDDSYALHRDMSLCIDCKRCARACSELQGMDVLVNNPLDGGFPVVPTGHHLLKDTECISCGQCAAVCPTGAITIRKSIADVWKAIYDPKKRVIAQVAPAVRVALGEEFGMDPGAFVEGKMVALLRAPGGCPWDRAQTNDSIKGNMIEEAYELVDAINRGDDDGIEEECGDVLLQAAFHSVMKSEQGAFNGGDVLTRVVKKLIFRHSHIFGGDKAADEGAALGVWEKNKMKEKHQTTYTESLKAVPINFPACMRAQKVGKRAAKSGMDFLSPLSASERMGEEVVELLKALQAEDKEGVFEEAGDVLLSAVNTCRLAGVDCEQALAAATDKFIARFAKFEELVLADGKACADLCDEEYDWYWLQAKNAIKGN